MSLAVGSRLGPYEILSPIGRGGMGEVYRARHASCGRDVAIKVLPRDSPATASAPGVRARGARRSALNHPNIVTIHDFAEPSTDLIAMEFVEGRTLGS